MVNLGSIFKQILLGLIRLYRFAFSLLLGNRCRFEPTCSSYAMTALERFGVLKGSLLTTKRLLKCHPWHPGGMDTVPEPLSHCQKSQHVAKTEV